MFRAHPCRVEDGDGREDLESQPGTLAFSHCLPAGHPQHQSVGFKFGSLAGEGRDRTDVMTAWLKTFPFAVLFLLRGGGGVGRG